MGVNITLGILESFNRHSGRSGREFVFTAGAECVDFPLRIAFEAVILQRYDFTKLNVYEGVHDSVT